MTISVAFVSFCGKIIVCFRLIIKVKVQNKSLKGFLKTDLFKVKSQFPVFSLKTTFYIICWQSMSNREGLESPSL